MSSLPKIGVEVPISERARHRDPINTTITSSLRDLTLIMLRLLFLFNNSDFLQHPLVG